MMDRCVELALPCFIKSHNILCRTENCRFWTLLFNDKNNNRSRCSPKSRSAPSLSSELRPGSKLVLIFLFIFEKSLFET